MSRRSRLTPYVWAAAGGVLYFLGFVGWGIWPLLFVFLVPLWCALERTRDRGASASFLAGLVFGFAAFAGGFTWLWRLVGPFLDGSRTAGVVLWLAYGTWFALGFAVYAWLVHAVRRRGWPFGAAAVAALVLVEWLQPQLFPLYAGSGLVAAPVLVQSADLGGPLLLTALMAVGNLVAFESWRWLRGRRPPPWTMWSVATTVTLLVLGYGRLRMAALDAAVQHAPPLRVGLVQANLGLLEKSAQSVLTHRRHLEQTRELLADGPVDLVVWPETAYMRGLRGPLPISGRLVVEDLQVPLLFGGAGVREEDGRLRKSNSAFLVDGDGEIRDAYDKNLLIPLAEYAPFADLVPAVARWFPHVDDFGAATETPPLRLGPWRLATPICYEVIRPEFVRRMMRQARAHLLITLANDAWFGDSAEPWLHLALARLRAVEHRRFLVRATNSGVSAVVDPAGRVLAQTRLFARENLRATVRPLGGETVYARLGDWPGWLAAAIVGVGLVAGRVRSDPAARPRRSPDSAPLESRRAGDRC